MEEVRMTAIVLPVVLLMLSFLLKLLIDRSATVPTLIRSVFELPVDIAFLSISFVIAYTLYPLENRSDGLVYFVVYLVAAVIVVFLWRRSGKLYDQSRYILAGVLAILNVALCVTGLVFSIQLLLFQYNSC